MAWVHFQQSTLAKSSDKYVCCRLYLDGQLAGQIVNTSTYFGDDGVKKLVPGGAPAALSGPIHLCTRADNNNTRYFDGKVAYLGGVSLIYPVRAYQGIQTSVSGHISFSEGLQGSRALDHKQMCC